MSQIVSSGYEEVHVVGRVNLDGLVVEPVEPGPSRRRGTGEGAAARGGPCAVPGRVSRRLSVLRATAPSWRTGASLRGRSIDLLIALGQGYEASGDRASAAAYREAVAVCVDGRPAAEAGLARLTATG
jgi:hypothetical protein